MWGRGGGGAMVVEPGPNVEAGSVSDPQVKVVMKHRRNTFQMILCASSICVCEAVVFFHCGKIHKSIMQNRSCSELKSIAGSSSSTSVCCKATKKTVNIDKHGW